MVEVADQQFGSRALVLEPPVQLTGRIKVGIAEQLVKACHIGLIYACDGEATGTDVIVVDEVGIDAVAGLHLQFVGHDALQQDFARVRRVAEDRHLAFHKTALQVGQVIFRTDALERHAEEVVIGLQDAACERITLHMGNAPDGIQHLHHAVIDADGVVVNTGHRGHVQYLDMATEAHHLVADGVLET